MRFVRPRRTASGDRWWWAVSLFTLLLVLSAMPALVSAQGTAETCRPGLVVDRGESCVYPGTSQEFSVDSSGRGRFLFFTAGTGISARNTTVNGVVYDFVASAQGDGTWLIETAGDSGASTPPPAATPDTAATPTTAELEGRIEARRLSSGRVEFGFRPEDGERILPERRFFPADVETDRWLVSSDVASDGDVLGQITARLLDDGRIEFGFNPVEGERILPRARFFPTDAQTDRWLVSSAITIPLAAEPATTAPEAENTHDCAITALGTITSSVSQGGRWSSSDCVLSDGTYADVYSFGVSQATQVVIELASGTADSFLILASPPASDPSAIDPGAIDQSAIEWDDDGGDGLDSRISRTLEAGTYLAIANLHGVGETGSYTLTVSPETTESGGACRVGMTLRSGDFCTVSVPGISVGTDRFEIRGASGCYGGICSGASVNLNGFRASRSGTTWTIDAVP